MGCNAGAVIAAPAIAAPAIATTGLIGGYSTLGGHYYGKREAEADAEPLLLGAGYAGLAGAAIAAPAIAAPAIATTGLIGGYSTLGGHYYGKREAEAEPYLGYAGLGYGYAGAYGYGKSAPCVNAANFPVPCRGFY